MPPFYENRPGFVIETPDGWIANACLTRKKFSFSKSPAHRAKFSFLDATTIIRELRACNVTATIINERTGVPIVA